MSNPQGFAPRTPVHQSNLPRSSSFRETLSSSSLAAPKTVRWSQEQGAGKTSIVASSSSSNKNTSTPSSLVNSLASSVSTPMGRVLSGSIMAASSSPSISTRATVAQAPPPVTAPATSSSVTTPRASPSSLRNRIKWNSGALLAILALPKLDVSKRLYWSLLDVIYATFGGRSDQTADVAAGWLKWAFFIIFLVNLMEAFVLLLFPHTESLPPANRCAGLSRPPNSPQNVSAGVDSPISGIPSVGARPRGPSEARYSPRSPLKASLEAAGRSVSGGNLNASSSPALSSPLKPSGVGKGGVTEGVSGAAASGRRFPSGPPTNGARPLAAYLARRGTSRQHDRNSSNTDFDAVADLSSDSIEVDRALRALSNNYMRSVSPAATVPPQTAGPQ